MEALQVIAPLVGVVLGSALSGVGLKLKERSEHKRVIASALSDLLEVRHRIVGFSLVVAKVQTLTQLKPAAVPELRNVLDSLYPVDPGLEERYVAAVNLLAGIDPVLAHSLRSKHVLPKLLGTLRAKAIAAGADPAMFEAVESQLLTASRPTLDSAVLELARSHSGRTAQKVQEIINGSTQMPAEVSTFFDKLVSLDAATLSSGQRGV